MMSGTRSSLVLRQLLTVMLAAWWATIGPFADARQPRPQMVATVSVRDRGGNPIGDLAASSFTVTQNGRPITWRVTDPAPRDFLLLLDHSGSQSGGIGIDGAYSSDDGRSVRGQALAQRFGSWSARVARQLGDGLGAGDRARVASFGDSGRISGYHQSGESLAGAITAVRQTDAASPMWDAVFGLPDVFRSADHMQPVVLVVTDGLGTANTRSHAEALHRVGDSSVMVYSTATRIGLDANDRDSTVLSPRFALRSLADATGARLFETGGTTPDVAGALLSDLSRTYTLAIGPVDITAGLPAIGVSRNNATVVVRWVAR
jgi:hypothetical protein